MTANDKARSFVDHLSPAMQARVRLVLRQHATLFFAASRGAAPVAVVWFITTQFFDLITSIIAKPLMWTLHTGPAETWTLGEALLYILIVYATYLMFGGLMKWGLDRVFDWFEMNVIAPVPVLRDVWSGVKDVVSSIKNRFTKKEATPRDAGSYQYVGAFRHGGTIKILPITSIDRRTCSLWDPSSPFPTNGVTFVCENTNVVLLQDASPKDVIAKICATGMGLTAEAELFLNLESEGGHAIADFLGHGVITTGVGLKDQAGEQVATRPTT